MLNLTDAIIDYENGDLSADEIVQLFSQLIKTGMVWHLQGSYGRMAQHLIRNGVLDANGDIL